MYLHCSGNMKESEKLKKELTRMQAKEEESRKVKMLKQEIYKLKHPTVMYAGGAIEKVAITGAKGIGKLFRLTVKAGDNLSRNTKPLPQQITKSRSKEKRLPPREELDIFDLD